MSDFQPRSAQTTPATPNEDRLIFLADALDLVPFSETTLRRAISRGELEAWQPKTDGKLVIWRSALLEWATRRPANGAKEPAERRAPRSARRGRPHGRTVPRTPDPIRLPDLA